jgi:hypothetical protein
MKCLRLTTNAYMVGFGTQNGGLLLNQGDHFLYLTTKKRLTFPTLALFEKQFGKLDYSDVAGGTTELTELAGYPVKHSDAVLLSSGPATYSRSGHGVFVAGYWALRREGGWVLAFCPKHATISSGEAAGPFKTRLEVFNKIASMKRV